LKFSPKPPFYIPLPFFLFERALPPQGMTAVTSSSLFPFFFSFLFFPWEDLCSIFPPRIPGLPFRVIMMFLVSSLCYWPPFFSFFFFPLTCSLSYGCPFFRDLSAVSLWCPVFPAPFPVALKFFLPRSQMSINFPLAYLASDLLPTVIPFSPSPVPTQKGPHVFLLSFFLPLFL